MMSQRSRKNSLKQITSIVGIASIGIFSSLPAFALINKTDNNSSAVVNSANELLTQTEQGTENTPAPRTNSDDRSMPSGGLNNNPGSRQMPASQSAPSNTSAPSSAPSLTPEKTTTGNKPGPAGDNSLRPGSWFCLNNPNPQCRT